MYFTDCSPGSILCSARGENGRLTKSGLGNRFDHVDISFVRSARVPRIPPLAAEIIDEE